MEYRTLMRSMENYFKETEKVTHNVDCTISGTFDTADEAITLHSEMRDGIEVVVENDSS